MPTDLQWVNRGGILVRRINSERIAEDPRIKSKLDRTQFNLEQTFSWTPPTNDQLDEKVHWTERVRQHWKQTNSIQQMDVLMEVSSK